MGIFNFFDDQASNEWSIYNNNSHEFIEMYGIPVLYLQRKEVNYDELFGEDSSSKFDSAVALKMYLEDFYTFGSDVFSKFGLQSDDSIKLKIQQEHIISELSGEEPEIGDLIKFEFTDILFEITFIESEELFYVNGKTIIYRLDAKKLDYSGEQITADNLTDTGVIPLDGETTATTDDSIRDFTKSLEFTEEDVFNEY
jgi:hypothetical protein